MKVNSVGHSVSEEVGSTTNICEEILEKKKRYDSYIELQRNPRLGLEPDASKQRTH